MLELITCPAVFVTSIPPAVYDPLLPISPVAEYAVVAAPREAVARYNAPFIVSFVVAPRTTVVSSAWMPFNTSALKLVQTLWLLAILGSYLSLSK